MKNKKETLHNNNVNGGCGSKYQSVSVSPKSESSLPMPRDQGDHQRIVDKLMSHVPYNAQKPNYCENRDNYVVPVKMEEFGSYTNDSMLYNYDYYYPSNYQNPMDYTASFMTQHEYDGFNSNNNMYTGSPGDLHVSVNSMASRQATSYSDISNEASTHLDSSQCISSVINTSLTADAGIWSDTITSGLNPLEGLSSSLVSL